MKQDWRQTADEIKREDNSVFSQEDKKMIEVGRICYKIAGRDAGKKCVIIDVIDDNFVMIDGETRRRKCNVKHIDPQKDNIKIKKGADHKTVVDEFKKLGIEIKETKPKQKKEKPKKIRSEQRKKMRPKQEKTEKKKETEKKEKPEEKEERKEGTKLEKELSSEDKKE